jgi:hypothetical protein
MREVTAGASAALLVKVAAAAATFGLSVVLGRKIGAAGTGVYYLAFAVISVAAVFGRIGLDNVVTRYIAAACAGGRLGARPVGSSRGIAHRFDSRDRRHSAHVLRRSADRLLRALCT